MDRERLRALAQETVEIGRAGRYTVDGQVIQLDAVRPTELWTAEELDRLVQETELPAEGPSAAIEVRGEGTVDAIFRLSGGARLCPELGVLNFASAKNPGGGFLNGSVAQEECLAFCSDLYQTQTTGQGPRYYEINRAVRDPVYTDTMLIGDVTFFRTSGFSLTAAPVTCPAITAPAVNMGIVVRNGDSVDRAKQVMKGRMEKILALFAGWGCTRLVLGAYGCGVFRNDPEDVARSWQELLEGSGWGRLFEQVSFSILERPGRDGNIVPFRRRFG
ncbi:TIGR02452 family protein [bacterium 1xD42-67]|nr:TIGR02452 family protein [bacterium 1xD42-67]